MKKYKQQAAPTFTIDASGQRLAHVALSGTTERTTLYADDLENLQAAGWSRHWSLASTGGRFRYVLAYARNPIDRVRSITVARLIAGAGKGQRVTYADGNRLNLRRDNLRIVTGGGNAHTPAAAIQPSKRLEPQAVPLQPSILEPLAPYTPRVIDRAALSARVKAMQAGRTEGGP
jgi:hypothetical protein